MVTSRIILAFCGAYDGRTGFCRRDAGRDYPEAPKAAPGIDIQDTVNAFRTIEPKNDKMTVVHFWATWCAPCVTELPAVVGFYDDYKDKGVNVIAVSMDGGNMRKVQAYYLDHQITHLKPYLDANGKASKAYGISGLPTTVFINSKGEEIAAPRARSTEQ